MEEDYFYFKEKAPNLSSLGSLIKSCTVPLFNKRGKLFELFGSGFLVLGRDITYLFTAKHTIETSNTIYVLRSGSFSRLHRYSDSTFQLTVNDSKLDIIAFALDNEFSKLLRSEYHSFSNEEIPALSTGLSDGIWLITGCLASKSRYQVSENKVTTSVFCHQLDIEAKISTNAETYQLFLPKHRKGLQGQRLPDLYGLSGGPLLWVSNQAEPAQLHLVGMNYGYTLSKPEARYEIHSYGTLVLSELLKRADAA